MVTAEVGESAMTTPVSAVGRCGTPPRSVP